MGNPGPLAGAEGSLQCDIMLMCMHVEETTAIQLT